MYKLFIQTILLITISGALWGMSPVQFQQLQGQFEQAVNSAQFDRAQQLINQLPAGQRGAYAAQWQIILQNAQKRAGEMAREQADVKRQAEDQARRRAEEARLQDELRKKNEDEARKRADQARIEADRLANFEKQLKETAERERAAGRDYSAKLLQEIQMRDAQLKAQTDELNRLRNEQAQTKLACDANARGLAVYERDAKAKDETIQRLKQIGDEQAAAFEKYKKSCQEQLSAQPAQPQAGPTMQANQELRTRLAEIEKANASLRDQLAQAEKKCSAQASAAQELKAARDEVTKCQAQAAQIQSRVSDEQKIRAGLEAELSRVKASASTLSPELEKAQEDLAISAKRIAVYEQEGKAKDEATKKLKAVLDEQSASFDKYKKACEAQLKQTQAAEQELKDYKDRVEPGLRKQIDELKKTTITPAQAAQQSQIIQKKMDELLDTNQKLDKTVRDLSNTLEKANKELKASNEANSYLQKQSDEKSDEIFVIEADRDAAEASVKKLTADKEALQKQLEAARASGDKSCKDLEGQIKQLAAERAGLEKQVKELNEALLKRDNENARLVNDINRRKKLLDDAIQANEEAIEKYQKIYNKNKDIRETIIKLRDSISKNDLTFDQMKKIIIALYTDLI